MSNTELRKCSLFSDYELRENSFNRISEDNLGMFYETFSKNRLRRVVILCKED